MNIKAELLLASHNKLNNKTLYTFKFTFPRIILAEVNTHKMLCLAGDSILYFDLPHEAEKGGKAVFKMRLDEYVNKWHNGANRVKANPKKELDTSNIKLNKYYSGTQLEILTGLCKTAIHTACRNGQLKASKVKDKSWSILGSDFISWRNSKPEHTRFDIKDRLSNMKIRQLNEHTGKIQHSTVKDAMFSGMKEVYELETSVNTKLAASKDHRILTSDGWKPLKDIKIGDKIVTQQFGKKDEDKKDPTRFQKIYGKWRQAWQRKLKQNYPDGYKCDICFSNKATDIDHIIPVHQNIELVFTESNIRFVCEYCHHNTIHKTQGWQGGTYLYGGLEEVISIRYRGFEPTYDLEIAGEFPNFVANGVVVHNSKNTSSSRAVPAKKFREKVYNEPFIPMYIGANQKGMQAGSELEGWRRKTAELLYSLPRYACLTSNYLMEKIGVHKQISNRILEPWMWVEQLVSGTEWQNFINLRAHEKAEPHFQDLAYQVKDIVLSVKQIISNPIVWSGYKNLNVVITDDPGYIHAPLILPEEFSQYSTQELLEMSAARCARVSYFLPDSTKPSTYDKDKEIIKKLISEDPKHLSPFEHQATFAVDECRSGNFIGWHQFRKTIPNEDGTKPL